SGGYAHRPDALRWAEDAAQRRGLNVDWARQTIASANYQSRVVQLILPPAHKTAKNWHLYRKRIVEPGRIQRGAAFWTRNRQTLARAQRQFGVPPEIIVGILGVETIYGQIMGNFGVLDALATLAFDYPQGPANATARQAYFRDELGYFLTLCQRTGMSPGEPLGSYAGAMGMPQFMPSSWIRYAIDFDGDGHIDLWDNDADAIGSVANYFRAYGWIPGLPTHYAAQLNPGIVQADLNALLAPDILPTFQPAALTAKGVQLDASALTQPGPLALVELQNGDPLTTGSLPTYVIGTENFYVITRYNHSSYYAMAVIELGQAVAAALG
ncbi:MAG: lytic murein transglycosylase B, partial [Burkholderiaceae bacterium]|nr:lytic murein transglycosylase B [Burkholderiaceae bacterium]